jgi:hypothetical protein
MFFCRVFGVGPDRTVASLSVELVAGKGTILTSAALIFAPVG